MVIPRFNEANQFKSALSAYLLLILHCRCRTGGRAGRSVRVQCLWRSLRPRLRLQTHARPFEGFRGTWLMRKRGPLGPYSSPMPGALRCSWGGGCFTRTRYPWTRPSQLQILNHTLHNNPRGSESVAWRSTCVAPRAPSVLRQMRL